MKKIIVLTAFAALMACEPVNQYAPITSDPVNVKPVSALMAERLKSPRATTLRTFTMQDDKRVEVTGAKCSLKSDVFTAVAVTPANIINKEILGQPGDLTISCTSGKLKGGATYSAMKVVNTVGAGTSSLLVNLVVAVATTAISSAKELYIYNGDHVQSQNYGDKGMVTSTNTNVQGKPFEIILQ